MKLISPNEIDVEVCANSKCSRCGAGELKCKAWLDDERQYHVAAVCRKCGLEEEF